MLPVFRMSQAGYCPRKLSALYLNVSDRLAAPPWLESAAKEGVMHEQLLKQQLRELGCAVEYEQEELSLSFPTFTLLGHLDGKVKLSKRVLQSREFEVVLVDRPNISYDTFYPLECKSFSFNEYRRWRTGQFDAFPQYASQFTCYMKATDARAGVYVTKDRSGGHKQLFVLGGMPGDSRGVEENIGQVAESVSRGELVAGEYDGSRLECRRCEFRSSICKSLAPIVEDEDLLEVLRSFVESREIERAAKAELDKCRELILSYGKDRFRLGQFAVSVGWVDRESVSLRKLLELVPREKFEEAISSSHFPRLSVDNLEEV